MQKMVTVSLLLIFFLSLKTTVFAGTLNCKFKDIEIRGVEGIKLNDQSLIINNLLEIPLEKSRVKCGNFGRQIRFDGNALGYQVVLKTCTTDAVLEGHLIDSINSIAAEVLCHKVN